MSHAHIPTRTQAHTHTLYTARAMASTVVRSTNVLTTHSTRARYLLNVAAFSASKYEWLMGRIFSPYRQTRHVSTTMVDSNVKVCKSKLAFYTL